MKNTLTVKNIEHVLDNPKPEYKSMLSNINERMPAIRQASSNFYKGHSQFMNITVVCSHCRNHDKDLLNIL